MFRRSGGVLLCGFAIGVWLVFAAAPSGAHFATVSFVELSATRTSLTGRLLLDPYHLLTFLPLDTDGDTYISKPEVTDIAHDIRDLAQDALIVRVDGTPLSLHVGEPQLTTAATLLDPDISIQPAFALIEVPLDYQVERPLEEFTLAYDLFLQTAERSGTHQSFALLTLDGRPLRHAFGPETPTLRASLQGPPSFGSLALLLTTILALLGVLWALWSRTTRPAESPFTISTS